MSNINQTATVTLQANGQQVNNTLAQLKQRAFELENALAKAAAAGKRTDMRIIQKELNATRRTIRQMTSSVEEAERVMKRLDKATPKELQQTLRTLEKQLQNIERGSEAWRKQQQKIKTVREELRTLNAEYKTTQSFWTRMNATLNECNEYYRNKIFQPFSVQMLEGGEKGERSEYYDRIYLGYWDGNPPRDGRLPVPILADITVNEDWTYDINRYSLRLNTENNFPVHNIDAKQKYNFSFLSDEMPDVRTLFYIQGKKYVCQKITATFTENGKSQLLKGIFFPVVD